MTEPTQPHEDSPLAERRNHERRRLDSGPRRLMARLRDIMAASGSAQDRLDKIAAIIASEMVAEVCSVYIMRAGEVLELFATVGLNREAVRRTRLRVGEGLIGAIAATASAMALANARGHPAFAHRPETGEDRFSSLCGVPILRGGKVRGVLSIQNEARRRYTEADVEILQTIAMLVAELVASGELVSAEELSGGRDPGLLPQKLEGQGVNGGLAMGLAVLHRPSLTLREVVADDPEAEQVRLTGALAEMQRSIDAMVALTRDAGVGEPADILETYRMFAADQGWIERIRAAIRQGLTAEAAVERVLNGLRVRMSRLADPYMRERLQDLEDLTGRLLTHLAGRPHLADAATLPDRMILVARSMGPAELLDYDRTRLRGLILEEGSLASHVALVARAMDLPVVGRCASALARIEPLDPVIVDGDEGMVVVRPAEDIVEAYSRSAEMRTARARAYADLRRLPSVTLDGVPIRLMLNAGLTVEVGHLDDTAADGIGLYRTEIPFMVRSAYPDVSAQTALYREVLALAGDRPVVFRTLDVGGDKRLPYFPETHDPNPALGWRAIRIGLDRPAMLRGQIRALLRAGAGRIVHLMFPLIADITELDFARKLVALEQARLERTGETPPEAVRVGLMIEVPSLLWQLEHVLPSVDFISVGTNDLMQYMYAADRENVRISHRYDALAPSFLRTLKFIADFAGRHTVPVNVCGEMASRPLEAMALLGLGYRSLSVAPQAIGPVKTMLRSAQLGGLRAFLDRRLTVRAPSLRAELRSFAADHGIQLDTVAAPRPLLI